MRTGRPREAGPLYCTRCGKEIYKPPSQRKEGRRYFCGRECQMAYMNRILNPLRMTPEVRKKLRDSHIGSGEGKSYAKVYGRHEHRVVAEQMLGRPLKSGEVVHHINRDKRDNHPENLMIFSSQKEHAAYHAAHDRGW